MNQLRINNHKLHRDKIRAQTVEISNSTAQYVLSFASNQWSHHAIIFSAFSVRKKCYKNVFAAHFVGRSLIIVSSQLLIRHFSKRSKIILV